MLAPPLSTNYALVGTAFDYLLRFYCARINPEAKQGQWVGKAGLDILRRSGNARIYEMANGLFEQAQRYYLEYLQTGELKEQLLAGTIHLAKLDGIYRGHGLGNLSESNLMDVDDLDIADLRALMSLVREENFKARKRCVLNPSFGIASVLVRGADADIIVDDQLIDIKTTKNPGLDRSYVHQLIGYHVLSALQRVHDFEKDYQATSILKRVSIYFSRHGYMHTMLIDELIEPATFASLAKQFVNFALTPEIKQVLSAYRKWQEERLKEIAQQLLQKRERDQKQDSLSKSL